MNKRKIVGLTLARDDDIHLPFVLRNVIDFCDRLILLNHGSTDRTPQILKSFAELHPDKCEGHSIEQTHESHQYVEAYAGTDTWVFGVDGDEIYDPRRLTLLREQILRDDFQEYWMLIGNVLHCDQIDFEKKIARGYMAPPSKSMTKLYNFSAIDEWSGRTPQRLHGGTIRFRDGYSNASRKRFKLEVPWDESPFRCLHACFVRRSSLDDSSQARRNLSESRETGRLASLRRIGAALLRREPASRYKLKVYRMGRRRIVDASAFLP